MVDVVPGTQNKAVRDVVDGREYFTPIVSAPGVPSGGDATAAKQDDMIVLMTSMVSLLEDIKTNTTPAP
ncbi:hypothetical protein H0A71_06545 [Alcaligenaceae bacterium]|nr:hypothetical protein [Alcaligenaceae bacterium]